MPKGRCTCCSQKVKFHLGRANKIMILINFIIFIVFIAMGVKGVNTAKAMGNSAVSGSNDGYEALDDVGTVLVGLFALVAAILFIVIVLFACLTVCCYKYCCCCIALWVPITFAGAIIMCALAGILNSYQSNIRDVVCDAAEDTIKEFWDNTVDGFMCSEFCPCPDASLVAGGYTSLDDSTLS